MKHQGELCSKRIYAQETIRLSITLSVTVDLLLGSYEWVTGQSRGSKISPNDAIARLWPMNLRVGQGGSFLGAAHGRCKVSTISCREGSKICNSSSWDECAKDNIFPIVFRRWRERLCWPRSEVSSSWIPVPASAHVFPVPVGWPISSPWCLVLVAQRH